MEYEKDGRRYVVKIEPGENVHESLKRLAVTEWVKGATFHGVGATKDVQIGFYNLEEKKYRFKNYEGIFELVSMNGNIAWAGEEPVVHIHATYSGEDNAVFGGHVSRMVSAITVEVQLIALDVSLTRVLDEVSGLKLLKLSHTL